MDIREAHAGDRETWNAFAMAGKDGAFLQSWDWGAFQRSLGHATAQLKITDGDSWAGTALVVRHSLPFTRSYLAIPRGPILRTNRRATSEKLLSALLKFVAKHVANERDIFVCIDPQWEDAHNKRELLMCLGLKRAEREARPSSTSVLNLGKTDEELLENIKPKMRSRIENAARNGIRVFHQPASPQNKDIFREFWRIIKEGSTLDASQLQSEEHYRKLIQDGYISPAGTRPLSEILIAVKEKKVVAAAIVVYFGSRATWFHAASNASNHSYEASALIQWEAIREARRRGCTDYDFWGVSPPSVLVHPLLEMSKFKRGFGGIDVTYVGRWDMPLKKTFYRFLRAAELE